MVDGCRSIDKCSIFFVPKTFGASFKVLFFTWWLISKNRKEYQLSTANDISTFFARASMFGFSPSLYYEAHLFDCFRRVVTTKKLLFFLFDATTLVDQAPVTPQWAWLSYTNFITDGRYIQCTPYRGPTVHKGLERMTRALLSPTSWRLYHESCGLTTVI